MTEISQLLGAYLEDAIVVLASLTAFVSVMFLYRVMLVGDNTSSRMKAVAERSRELRAGLAAPPRRSRIERQTSMTIMRQIVDRLNLLRSREAEKAALNMARAGWRSRDALTVFFFLKFSLPFVFGGIGVFFIFVLGAIDGGTMKKLLIALSLVLLGAYTPDIVVKNSLAKRRQKMQMALPDALDLLVICVEAGQSLDAALARVANEISRQAPELAEELSLTTVELGLLPDRRLAFDNLNKRTDVPGIRNLISTLHQSEKYGTPVAHSLRVLSSEFRTQRLMNAEAKAARLPAILTVPMMIFILPPLFIVLIGPAILRVIDLFINM